MQIAQRDGTPELAPFYLGLTGLARAVPGIALTLLAGAVADRVDRRRLLLFSQTTMALNAAALAVVAYAGAASMPIVLLTAAVGSAAFAFDNPARQSMIPRIVPLPFLPSAIGMQSAAFNGASVIGPLIAGLLYLPIGIPGLFATNAISFAAIIGALIAMRPVPPIALGATRSLFASVVEGARYVRRNPTLAWVLTIAGTVFVTAGPTGALLPALTGEALWNGMSWLAALLTAMGLGAFLAALCVMNVARVRGLGRIFIAAGIANGAGLVAFALTANPVVSLLLAFVTGFSGTLMAGMGNNILQATTADAYRGRVMSLWGFLFIGLMPVGQLALGTIGTLLGINAALFIGGAIALTAAVYGARRVPAVAAWRAPVPARVEVEPDLSASAAVTTLK